MTEVWREKYRPTLVDQMIGCQELKRDSREWTAETTPPCLLFIGPSGVGKTTAAMALARGALGSAFDPANVVVTNASDDRGIGYIRDELKHIVSQKALMASHRYILMDEADSLTKDAQKALRQIMETSHKTVRFILTANDMGGFHSAIIDRCRVYHFKPMTSDEIEQVALNIHEQEQLPDAWKEYYRNLGSYYSGSARKVVDTLQSLSKTDDALMEHIRGRGNNMAKAALNLAGGDYKSLAAYILRELEEGNNRFGTLKKLRFRARPLLEEGEEWYAFMRTYGRFILMTNEWPDDDIAFFEYFVATLKQNMEVKR